MFQPPGGLGQQVFRRGAGTAVGGDNLLGPDGRFDPALLTPWASDKGVLPVFGAIGANDWRAAYENLFGRADETAEAAD